MARVLVSMGGAVGRLLSVAIFAGGEACQTLEVAGEVGRFGKGHPFADVAEGGGAVQEHHFYARDGGFVYPFACAPMACFQYDAAEILLA